MMNITRPRGGTFSSYGLHIQTTVSKTSLIISWGSLGKDYIVHELLILIT